MSEKSEKYDLILETAGPLFARYGIKKTTVDEIAQAAGMGKGTIYLYFKSKEEIFEAIVRKHTQEFIDKARKILEKDIPAEEMLRRFTHMRIGNFEETAKEYNVSFEAIEELRKEAEVLVEHVFEEEGQVLASILQLGVERGEMIVDDIPVVVLAMQASFEALDMPWVIKGRTLDVKKKADILVGLFINGLKKK
jgi:AcrR family transcriptional regulator